MTNRAIETPGPKAEETQPAHARGAAIDAVDAGREETWISAHDAAVKGLVHLLPCSCTAGICGLGGHGSGPLCPGSIALHTVRLSLELPLGQALDLQLTTARGEPSPLRNGGLLDA